MQTKQAKPQPMRTCMVTREKLPKRQLLRLVRVKSSQNANDDESTNFQVRVDAYNKLRGRGANIKPEPELLNVAIEKGHLVRALQLGRALTAEEVEKLKADFKMAVEEKQFRPTNKPVKFKVLAEEFNKL